MHVVQIWIMHINALKTHLMDKNVQTNPEKSQKITQHSCCSMLTREKIWKQYEAMDIVSPPKSGRSLPKPSCLLWEALFVRSIYPNVPQMGQKICHGMLVPLHDCMPSFMNFRWVLDLREFKNKVSQHFASNQRCPSVWNFSGFVSTFLYTYWVFQAFYVHNSNLNYMHMVQCI